MMKVAILLFMVCVGRLLAGDAATAQPSPIDTIRDLPDVGRIADEQQAAIWARRLEVTIYLHQDQADLVAAASGKLAELAMHYVDSPSVGNTILHVVDGIDAFSKSFTVAAVSPFYRSRIPANRERAFISAMIHAPDSEAVNLLREAALQLQGMTEKDVDPFLIATVREFGPAAKRVIEGYAPTDASQIKARALLLADERWEKNPMREIE